MIGIRTAQIIVLAGCFVRDQRAETSGPTHSNNSQKQTQDVSSPDTSTGLRALRHCQMTRKREEEKWWLRFGLWSNNGHVRVAPNSGSIGFTELQVRGLVYSLLLRRRLSCLIYSLILPHRALGRCPGAATNSWCPSQRRKARRWSGCHLASKRL